MAVVLVGQFSCYTTLGDVTFGRARDSVPSVESHCIVRREIKLREGATGSDEPPDQAWELADSFVARGPQIQILSPR